MKKKRNPYDKNIKKVKDYLKGNRKNDRICTTPRGAKMCEEACNVLMARDNPVDKEYGLFMWVIYEKK